MREGEGAVLMARTDSQLYLASCFELHPGPEFFIFFNNVSRVTAMIVKIVVLLGQ